MPEFAKAVIGNFCWVELQTVDPAAAKGFYTNLFGWNLAEMQGQNGQPYTVADVGGKVVSGIMKLPEEAKKMGAPPNWASYVAVESAADSVAKAKKLGGQVLADTMDVGIGLLAVLQDPTGAVFCVWQEKQSMGTFLAGEPGALAWNELSTTNVDVAQRFYTGLFGWKAEAQQMPGMTYTIFKNGEAMAGGMMSQPKEMAGVPSHWAVYFTVADADASFAKAKSLGAKVLAPLMDVPDVGRMGYLQDPQGAAFAILKFFPMPAK